MDMWERKIYAWIAVEDVWVKKTRERWKWIPVEKNGDDEWLEVTDANGSRRSTKRQARDGSLGKHRGHVAGDKEAVTPASPSSLCHNGHATSSTQRFAVYLVFMPCQTMTALHSNCSFVTRDVTAS